MNLIVWIISENKKFAAELVGGARELCGADARVVAFVGGNEDEAGDIISMGADAAYAMPIPDDVPWECYTPVLACRAADEKPGLILVASTKRGKDMAAQLAGLLDAPCVSDATSIKVSDGTVEAVRMVYGGMAEKTVSTTAATVLVTVPGQSYAPREADSSRTGKVETLSPESTSLKVVSREPRQKGSVNLPDASCVIGVGRGFVEESELQMAHDLASAMEAEIACTRPIAEFFKWLPEELYLGISGQSIKPQVYLAAGISGQAQHISGVRDAKVIVSVNKDENAPIFDVSDYYIVGDIKEVLPVLTEAFKTHKN